MVAGKIITVQGEIESGRLGFCQPHEHLCIEPGPASKIYPALCIDEPEKTAVDVKVYKAAGGSAIVDAQPLFTGRNAKVLRGLSEECGVHIIASTGFHKLFYYGEGNPFLESDEETLAEIFISEIETGMYAEPFYTEQLSRTDIRAGLIKTALEQEFTDTHQKLFSAAARASLATGAAIMIHTDKGSDTKTLFSYLTDKGVAPDRMIFCHLDRTEPDLDVHKDIASRGAYLEYDTIARYKYHDDEADTKIIKEIISAGYAKKIMLSLDVTRERLQGYNGTPGLAYLLATFYASAALHEIGSFGNNASPKSALTLDGEDI
jgi:phosphotriesterase-related protein